MSYQKLKDFFDQRPVAHKATSPLGKKALGAVIFRNEPTQSYSFKRSGKFATLSEESPAKPDFTIRLDPGAVDELVAFPSESVGDFGVKFFKMLKRQNENQKIELSIHIGFFKIVSRGYLKVLLLGGPVVMSVLKDFGVSGVSSLKKLFSKKK